ncbi:thialysine N-epsilon-acetyltransferase-like [Synchiropus splendidus]|uniref:thialysine N-epsilon-acetyltransferase-like n=1 Tax=Synchiropus splendidus TaxID=270530 RepID=UPI00237D3C1A|nr:thialysine N-epsilon-acetyltransferase-like [Synchiropus splendidus]
MCPVAHSRGMKYDIRPATRADVSNIYGMIKELACHEHKAEQVKTSLEDLERHGFCQNPVFHCLVAEVPDERREEAKTAGYALYYYTYSTWSGPSLYLEDLYVKPDYRGMGIGKQLLANVAKVGRDNSCVHLQLTVSEGNASARAFYDANGGQDLTGKEGWHMIRFSREDFKNLASEAM